MLLNVTLHVVHNVILGPKHSLYYNVQSSKITNATQGTQRTHFLNNYNIKIQRELVNEKSPNHCHTCCV